MRETPEEPDREPGEGQDPRRASPPGAFVPTEGEEEAEREAARRIPLWPWAVLVAGGVWLVLAVDNPVLQAIAALPALFAAIRVWRVPRQRAALRRQLLERRRTAPMGHAEADPEDSEDGPRTRD